LKSILNRQKLDFLKQEFKKTGKSGMPMGIRLFLFLVVLLLTIFLGVVAILLLSGTFTAGLSETGKMVEQELIHASEGISRQYGQLSLEAIEFSKGLSRSIEEKARELGISLAHLQQHPELLEEIISGEYERALFFLQLSKSSGVFFVLNATVNPDLPHADRSRAGLYLKNMEPNILNAAAPTIIVLRGFPSIARKNSLYLHSQLKMEFDISDAPYYYRPMEAAAANPSLPMSRLYYWCPVLSLPDTSDKVMLCSVPLIDSEGKVFGVCGLETSEMLFKLSYMPNRNSYYRIFCVFSPVLNNTIDLDQSLFAGGYSSRLLSHNGILDISDKGRYFYSYTGNGDSSFLGNHTDVDLYPEDSAFAGERWAAAVMIPEKDVVSTITKLNEFLVFLLILLFILGIVASFFLSRKFLQPIVEGFDILKSEDLSEAPKTKVPEINGLIDFLKQRNLDLYERAKQENLSISILDEFLEKTKTLTPSEQLVFNLYVEGYTAKEAAEILCLSINTIKTHNKRIYSKLNVGSRDELLLYVNLLKELGKEIGGARPPQTVDKPPYV
jgi:DNA-binding CsgD family transcriptional regulator